MTPFEISDSFVEGLFELSPLVKTQFGIPGSNHLWDDFSMEGHSRLIELARETTDLLADHRDHEDRDQARAARVLHASLGEMLDRDAHDDHLRDLNHIYSPLQQLRDIFDIAPKETAGDWSDRSARLETIGEPLAGYRERLVAGIADGLVTAQRQVDSVIEQARALIGEDSQWNRFPEEADRVGADVAEVTKAVAVAKGEVALFTDWLEAEYMPHAAAEDGVGIERYLRSAEQFIGERIDPEETYEWGWTEVHRLLSAMEAVAASIDPDKTVSEVIDDLETDPARSAPDLDSFVAFVQQRLDQAVVELDGTHFDVPDEIKRVTVNIAPPGGALGAWYISPSEDFSRPGSVWYSFGELTVKSLWQEVSTAYHEGFPGHHLQVGTAMCQGERLSRAHRLLIWYPGYGEGWALYTERLMEELGYFERPEYLLGMLSMQMLRAVRVVVDIGCHLGLKIPDDAPLYPGEPWDYHRAVDYVHQLARNPTEVAVSEVKRYLGWPGQAISYKVGERAILDIREKAQRSPGFDLKDFHRRMLDGGARRLDQLREEMLDN